MQSLTFTFQTTPRIIFEEGGAAKVGGLLAELGVRRPVVITDSGLLNTGVVDSLIHSIESSGGQAAIFSGVLADPPEPKVLEAVQFAKNHQADGVIGIGGGSSMDTAKLVALLVRTPQDLNSAYGIGLARGPRLPLVQIPTTAGTGSEVTPIAIVTTPTEEKKGVVSPLLFADVAIVDATLTVGLPPGPTAMTGVDAMVHAIEAYTSRHLKNFLSDALALKALELLHRNIRTAVSDGKNLPARSAMLQGSLLAGMAFANAPVAAVHALAYPIGGRYHVPHGLSNALVLVPVLQFNAPAAQALYAELAATLLPDQSFASDEAACAAFILEIARLVESMPFPTRLRDVGVEESALPAMANDASQISRLLVNNPREITKEDILEIYRSVW
jgi:alcohol dehydrogenase class IV